MIVKSKEKETIFNHCSTSLASKLLVRCLCDTMRHVRHAAAVSLGRIGEHCTEAVPSLLSALYSGSVSRKTASWALSAMGFEGISALLQCLDEARIRY